MNKKFFIIILISMSLSLLGIIAVQSYFIKSNLEKNNQEFELNINQVLTTVSNDIEKREYSEYVYKFNELTYPATSQGLDALIMPHSELKRPFLYPEGGYISSIPTDPWGREYIYEYPPQKSKNYDLYSLGADGIEGGTGENSDIGNWLQ